MIDNEALKREWDMLESRVVNDTAAKAFVVVLRQDHEATVRALRRLAWESKCPLQDIDGHPNCGLTICNFRSEHCQTARMEWALDPGTER